MSNTKKKTNSRTSSSGRSGSTGQKKASAGSTTRKVNAQRKQEKAEKKAFLIREAGFILFMFIALFLLISNFGLLGKVGTAVSGFQKGLFGYAGYLFPVLVVVLVCCFAKKEKSFLFWFKIFSGLLLFASICTMLHLAFGAKSANTFGAYYAAGKAGELKNMAAGGAVGGVIGDALKKSMASFGAWFLLIMLVLLCIVLISEKSIVNYLKKRAAKASELAQSGTAYAKEKFREERIRREARKEADELRRKEEAMDRELAREGIGTSSVFSPVFDLKKEHASAVPEYNEDAFGSVGGTVPADRNSCPGNEDPDDIRLSEKIRESREEENADMKEAAAEPDYDVDEVPFAETNEERYKAYGKMLSGGKIDAVSADHMGFAVSRNTETYSRQAGEPEAAAFNKPEGYFANEDSQTDGITAFSEAGHGSEESFLDESYDAPLDKDHLHRPVGPDEFGYPDALGTDVSADFSAGTAKSTGSMMTGAAPGYDDFYNITDEARDSVYDERKRAAAEATKAKPFTEKAETAAFGQDPTGANSAGTPQPVKTAPRPVKKRPYQFPPVNLLKKGSRTIGGDQAESRENARKLERVLAEFGVGVHVTNVVKGPRVTRYEMSPDMGVKVSRITALKEDLMLALAASDLRIEAPIPGKSAVGIEVPNNESSTVTFRDILESDEFKKSGSKLSWGVGLDIQGAPVVGDISKMPHLLISGTTGSGKSVGINSIIMSVIYRAKPEQVRMILIDPKVVELSVYDGIPHLLSPVVTKPDKALAVLNKACAEMQLRYRLFKESNTRNIVGYNEKVEEVSRNLPEGTEKPEKLPYILIIIDELSELMMHSKRDVEAAIVSLAQLARAAGIHLVVATQRPSVDVVTGLIKANIPSRAAYKLPSGTDSRTIIDSYGAETLLGNGDMLYKPGNFNNPLRVQGAYLSDGEVEEVVDWLKKHNSSGYEDDWENVKAVEKAEQSADGEGGEEAGDGRDQFFCDAGMLITEKKKASIGLLQRKFKIGFNRASRIMDELNEAGVVSDSEGTKERQILMSAEEFRERFTNG